MQIFLDDKRYEPPDIRAKFTSYLERDEDDRDSANKVIIFDNKRAILEPKRSYTLRIRFCHSDAARSPLVFYQDVVAETSHPSEVNYIKVALPPMGINEPDGPMWYLAPNAGTYYYTCSYLGVLLWVQEMAPFKIQMEDGDNYTHPGHFNIGYGQETLGGDIDLQSLMDVFYLARTMLVERFLQFGQAASEERERMDRPYMPAGFSRFRVIS